MTAWAKIVAVIVGGLACFAVAAYAACGSGCSGASVTPTTARAEARAVDLAAKDAVVSGYQACSLAVGALSGAAKEDLRAKCHAGLDPAAAGVELGAQAVDAWDDTAAGSYACAMADVLGGLTRLEGLLSSPPPALVDALVLLRAMAPSCTAPAPDVVTAPIDAPAPPPVAMPPLGAFHVPPLADAFLTEDALAAPVDAGGAS